MVKSGCYESLSQSDRGDRIEAQSDTQTEVQTEAQTEVQTAVQTAVQTGGHARVSRSV